MTYAPKILSIRKAVKPRYGVDFYAEVQSRTEPLIHYTVTIGKRTAVCTCLDSTFRRTRRKPCDHIKAVRDRLAKRKS